MSTPLPMLAVLVALTTWGCQPPTTDPADAGADDAGATQADRDEIEPNDGATLDAVDSLQLEEVVAGRVATPGDADVFLLVTTPGQLYRAAMVLPEGSALHGHLAVFDAGSDGSASGQDYVKIVRSLDEDRVELEFLAQAVDGYYLAVRDARDVDGAAAGGDAHRYLLQVQQLDLEARAEATLGFPSSFADRLEQRGGVRLYPFSWSQGATLVADLRADDASAAQGLDARLTVVSQRSGDWVARQDDRAATDPDPLLDAPLFSADALWLVVENTAERAQVLGYTLSVSAP